MTVSKLQYDIEALKLKHEFDLKSMQMSQELEIKQLINSCTHTYDDNSSAKKFKGTQRDYYYECGICGKTL